MRDARKTSRRTAQSATMAAEAPRTGRWIAFFFLLSSLLAYAEIRSEVSRLQSRAVAETHAGVARAAMLSYPDGVAAMAAKAPDVD